MLYGLILIGGKSQRMGQHKGDIVYHNIPQQEYLYKIAEQYCDKVFYSCREEQISGLGAYPYILDNGDIKGPFAGIIAAHKQYPDAAWLVLACDLPNLDDNAIEYLILNRNRDKMATAYATQASKLPEPLVAIWEAIAIEKAKSFVAQDKRCPRKFLINEDIQIVFPSDDKVLFNANTPEELKEAQALINPDR